MSVLFSPASLQENSPEQAYLQISGGVIRLGEIPAMLCLECYFTMEGFSPAHAFQRCLPLENIFPIIPGFVLAFGKKSK